jgi:hypothetical protein
LERVLSLCAREAFLAILPETSVPIDLIPSLRATADQLNLTIIAGLEHEVTWLPSGAGENYRDGAYTVRNSLAVVRPGRPVITLSKNAPAIVSGHTIVEQIERAAEPEFLILKHQAPDGRTVVLWAILCSDFLELMSGHVITHEMLEKIIRDEKIDIIAVLSHTQRVDPFHSAIEQLLVAGQQRALPTNIVFANLASYGGSVCWAYLDRKSLRESIEQRSEFWQKRSLRKDVESYTVFPDWRSALDEVRRARGEMS